MVYYELINEFTELYKSAKELRSLAYDFIFLNGTPELRSEALKILTALKNERDVLENPLIEADKKAVNPDSWEEVEEGFKAIDKFYKQVDWLLNVATSDCEVDIPEGICEQFKC